MRIEPTFHRRTEKSRDPSAVRKMAEPFFRSGVRSDVPGTEKTDRMFQSAAQRVRTMLRIRPSEPPSCYRAAYNAVIEKSSVGMMPSHFPYHDRHVAVSVDDGIVRLSIDPAGSTKNPCMTLGPGGKLTHGRDMSEQACIHMATALWGVATSDSILF